MVLYGKPVPALTAVKLVLAVDANQVCTQQCLLQTFDIKTMQKEDAAFKV